MCPQCLRETERAWPKKRTSGQREGHDAWQTVRVKLKQRGGNTVVRTLKDEAKEAENHFTKKEDE